MALPTNPKKDPRPVAVSLKLSKRAVDALRALSKAHNMSQGEVVEHLVLQELKESKSK